VTAVLAVVCGSILWAILFLAQRLQQYHSNADYSNWFYVKWVLAITGFLCQQCSVFMRVKHIFVTMLEIIQIWCGCIFMVMILWFVIFQVWYLHPYPMNTLCLIGYGFLIHGWIGICTVPCWVVKSLFPGKLRMMMQTHVMGIDEFRLRFKQVEEHLPPVLVSIVCDYAYEQGFIGSTVHR
jgi:hypothetical protein